ncbi:MAG TPA: hypothetical protein VGY66_15645 [Gemmataceae bacterium]|nr:hypothetical protein [Gemmataceae bacterium]
MLNAFKGIGAAGCLPILHSYQIVSLWDVLEFNAHRFVALITQIKGLRTGVREAMSRHGAEAIIEEDLSRFDNSALGALREECIFLDLDSGADQVARIKKSLEDKCTWFNYDLLLADLLARIEDQFRSRLFMYIPRAKAAYWQEKALFGKEVEARFPRLSEDIEEAGKCFAAARYTASVFHLMRVMESAVKTIARKFKVTVNLRDTWGDILRNIHAPIQAMPQATAKQKSKRDSWLSLEAHLYAVKEAWRNSTMHPKATYTEEEAKAIFGNVKTFMEQLIDYV